MRERSFPACGKKCLKSIILEQNWLCLVMWKKSPPASALSYKSKRNEYRIQKTTNEISCGSELMLLFMNIFHLTLVSTSGGFVLSSKNFPPTLGVEAVPALKWPPGKMCAQKPPFTRAVPCGGCEAPLSVEGMRPRHSGKSTWSPVAVMCLTFDSPCFFWILSSWKVLPSPGCTFVM